MAIVQLKKALHEICKWCLGNRLYPSRCGRKKAESKRMAIVEIILLNKVFAIHFL